MNRWIDRWGRVAQQLELEWVISTRTSILNLLTLSSDLKYLHLRHRIRNTFGGKYPFETWFCNGSGCVVRLRDEIWQKLDMCTVSSFPRSTMANWQANNRVSIDPTRSHDYLKMRFSVIVEDFSSITLTNQQWMSACKSNLQISSRWAGTTFWSVCHFQMKLPRILCKKNEIKRHFELWSWRKFTPHDSGQS